MYRLERIAVGSLDMLWFCAHTVQVPERRDYDRVVMASDGLACYAEDLRALWRVRAGGGGWGGGCRQGEQCVCVRAHMYTHIALGCEWAGRVWVPVSQTW